MKTFVVRVVILLQLTIAGFLVPAANAQFLPPECNVVLVTGIPGDLESEQEYEQQVQAWLDLATSASTHIYLLSDIQLAETPATSSIKQLKATRQEFLGLTNRLADSTKPCVFVIWGHGGLQGSTPVFHVRGPRLTPADLKAVGDCVTNSSHWILCFPGSGSFARELAKPGRQILSSDNETRFTSDPISMAVLVKKLTADPSLDFEAAAKQLGAGVALWYTDRNLARTEEPTLWRDLQTPEPLVHNSEKEGDSFAAPHTLRDASPSHATNLPAAWQGIARIDPQNFSDCDAVILNTSKTYSVGDRPAVSIEVDEFIQVLTQEGKKFGDFDFAFHPPEEDISFIACEVLKPNGDLLRLDPEAIRETNPSGVSDFNPARRKFFSLPQVGPGCVLHVHYRTSWKSFPLPHFSTQVPLASESPVLRETVRCNIPKNVSFHYALARTAGSDPEIKQSEYGTSYLWSFKDLPAQKREVLSIPNSGPELLLSTFPDWKDFAEWYGRISKLSDEITPEITRKAGELTRDCKTDEDRIAAIYNYVTGLRYVAVEMGVNSYRPHAAANVLQNQFGDCKDKANLFNALVRSLNVEKLDAHLVLVPRFSQADENTPGLAFNHAISHVVLGEKTLWIDTTDDVCRFGMLPPGDPGRKVLVIDGKTASLTQLPTPNAKDHKLTIRSRVDVRDTHQSEVPVSADVETRGYCDYEFRAATRGLATHAANSPIIATKFRLVNGALQLDKQTHSSVSSLEESFALHMEGAFVGIASSRNGQCVLSLPFWIPAEWEALLHRRSSGAFLNSGYPLSLEESVEFQLPEGAHFSALPNARSSDEGPVTWRVEWKREGTKILASITAEMAVGELSPADIPATQRQIKALLAAVAEGFTYGQ